ncbi:hypothetical protein NBRC3299_0227 [Acetobacter pasteurianus NBRC 3299]|nr:hypothetical protein BBA71_01950 [Acetobacter pasteurianus]GCD73935.1 hypothetical protein NBRC3299_0227 [Acetobacter pasteurianus NBRC 3299]
MTDARTEAALNAAWSHTIQYQGGMSFSQYQEKSPDAAGEFSKAIIAAIEVADAAAWRPIAEYDGLKPILVLQGKSMLVARPVRDLELSEGVVWVMVEGKTNEESGAYLVFLDPQPTHWRPLPTPPSEEMQP